MRINNNLMAMNTHRQLGINAGNGAKSIEKLSSGYRINRAGDDAAGLSISEKMRSQIRGLGQASRNSQDGISLIQTAEGALNETHDILQRMRELAVQSANDTNVTVDRGEIQKEINQLTSEINRIGNTTEFNTMKLLNGEKADTIKAVKADAATYTKPTAGVTVQTGAIALSASGISIDDTATIGTGTWADVSSGTVSISKDTSGKLSVDITAQATGGTVVMNIADVSDIEFTNDSYTYDDHGVTFTISKDDFEAATAGQSISLELTTANTHAGGTAIGAGVGQSYAASEGATWTGEASLSVNVVVGADVEYDIARIEVNVSSGASSATIVFKDAGGNVLITDDYQATGAAAATYAYDNHGVSFTVGSIATTNATTFAMDLDYSMADKEQGNSVTFQVGANENQSLDLSIADMRAESLGISTTLADSDGYSAGLTVSDGTSSTDSQYALNLTTSGDAANAITSINTAIQNVSSERSKLGAVQNRLEHTIKNLDTSAENLQASESRIRDVDMAKEMMEFTKNNILQQAAQSMLAQANQAPQGVLQLLR